MALCSTHYLKMIQDAMGYRKHSNGMMYVASRTKPISKSSHHTNLCGTYATASWLWVGHSEGLALLRQIKNGNILLLWGTRACSIKIKNGYN